MPRRAWAAASALVAAAVLLGACAAVRAPQEPPASLPDAAQLMDELMSGKVPVGGPFELEDPDGRRRSLAEFRGKIVLLYFGYTYCPDVCPTDLARIAAAIRSLGPRALEVQPLFVTLDPARDTPAVLREYAAAFDPRLIALRGSEEETRRIATAYKVYYERRESAAGEAGYLIDHAAFIFVLDRSGAYVAFFPPGTPAERMAAMLRDAL